MSLTGRVFAAVYVGLLMREGVAGGKTRGKEEKEGGAAGWGSDESGSGGGEEEG